MKNVWQNLGIVVVVMFGVCGAYIAFSFGHDYEERDSEEIKYISPANYLSLLFRTDEICENAVSERQNIACEAMYKTIAAHTTTHELAAQETIALATRGLLKVGALQAATSCLTLAFLVWTVALTRGMLGEAKEATKATHESLSITREANIHSLRAYIEVVNAECRLVYDESVGKCRLSVDIYVLNGGRSPANKLGIFQVHQCSVAFLKGADV